MLTNNKHAYIMGSKVQWGRQVAPLSAEINYMEFVVAIVGGVLFVPKTTYLKMIPIISAFLKSPSLKMPFKRHPANPIERYLNNEFQLRRIGNPQAEPMLTSPYIVSMSTFEKCMD